MGKFEIKKVKTGVKFNLKAGNGEVIATSEVYSTMASCKNGIASVQKNAPSPHWRIRRSRVTLPRRTPSLRSTPIRRASSVSA